MTSVGLIAMSGKPFHAGHDGLIRRASTECDEVHLYVSTSDRIRKGELPILGSDMMMLWRSTIQQTMPNNVKVTYSKGSPIKDVWEELGKANEEGSLIDYRLYADPVDLVTNFPPDRLAKYCGSLYTHGHVKHVPVERSSTVDTSGTQMRQFLADGNKEAFLSHLPVSIDRALVWDTLSASRP